MKLMQKLYNPPFRDKARAESYERYKAKGEDIALKEKIHRSPKEETK